MSWWTKARDFAESAVSTVTPFDVRSKSARNEHGGATGAFNQARDYEEGVFNKITGRPSSEDTRNQAKMVQDQIKAYQDQTALAKQQLDEARDATNIQKRRVEEKQIRSLRRNYRAAGAGMLGVGASDTPDMNQKLGG